MKKMAKKRQILIIRTEEQLLKHMRLNHWHDIYYCATMRYYPRYQLNKFWFAGRCIDRRLMFKLLKENNVKVLTENIVKDNEEFLIQLALGSLTDNIEFYHVERGIWRDGEQYLVER